MSSAQQQILNSQLQSLQSLHARLSLVRNVPSVLLNPNPGPASSVVVRDAFHLVNQLRVDLLRTEAQEALETAKSAPAGCSRAAGVVGGLQRKRKRPEDHDSAVPSSGSINGPGSSEMAYLPDTTLSPPDSMTVARLPAFIRAFNAHSTTCRLYLHSSRPIGSKATAESVLKDIEDQDSLVVLRFVALNVFRAFITLETDHNGAGAISIDTVVAFGPREKKPPHAQSDYLAYNALSQRISAALHSRAKSGVPLDGLIALLSSYSTLFVDPCTRCGRVLASDPLSPLPPVVRIWLSNSNEVSSSTDPLQPDTQIAVDQPMNDPVSSNAVEAPKTGRWEPRHIGCLYA